MTTETIPTVIECLTQKIIQEFEPEKIVLFGSWSKGEQHEGSDIDLLVVKETSARRIDREYELRKKLFGNNFPSLDLLVYTSSEVARRIELKDFFVTDVLKHGMTLYEKR